MSQIRGFLSKLCNSSDQVPPMSKRNKKILVLSIVASLLLVGVVIGVAIGVSSEKKPSLSPSAHAVLKRSCSATRYPELCYSAVAESKATNREIRSQKDVIEASLNITVTAVEHNYFKIEKLTKRSGLTDREKAALHDCLEAIDDTLDDLYLVAQDLDAYPAPEKSLRHYANNLETLMSAAMTDQDTCLDGFSYEKADKKIREALEKSQVHVEKMLGNALAMIKNMTDTDVANSGQDADWKVSEEIAGSVEEGWPNWLSAEDRELLQSPSVRADVTVAADGSGDFKMVADAVAAAPDKSKRRFVIRIKAGVYRENVEVGKKKKNVVFVGDGRSKTIITGHKNVVDGSTTFHSATVAAAGERFMARDITFQNTAGPSKHQAVALRVDSDFSVFYRCEVLAYQDTLYVHSKRQFFAQCIIVGTVDFIFGNAAVVIQDSDIQVRRPNAGQKNMVTAQGRKDPNQNTGIVIQGCRISATPDLHSEQRHFPTFLGRPWKEYSRTVVMRSTISDVIRPEGWHEWDGDFALDTLSYREYRNTGPGAEVAGRVKWEGFKVITDDAEAQQYTTRYFIAGED